MSILTLPKMTFSHEGWSELEKKHSPLISFLALVVIPLALLPPVMLYYAGSNYGDRFIAGFGSKPWGAIATAFFMTEMLTVALMGWLIKETAKWYSLHLDNNDAYRLAGIAPIPMWLSSLSLLIPSLPLAVGIAVVALAAGCGLLYNGICAFCHTHDEVSVAGITQTVMSAGVLCWVLLVALIVIP